MGESLDRVAASLGIDHGLLTDWAQLVGPALAEHTRPRGLREGTLIVLVDDPAWATQLRWLEADLVARLNELVGPDRVQRIEVRVRGAVTPDW
jgi:predicted nucleic acid-binding Zn ribbon protein